MALISRAGRARRRPRASWARAASAAGVLVMAVVVAACGNGNSGSSGGTTDGFKQAAQSAGALTVWVDSTRAPAVQAYKKAHPGVKLDVVIYDGDANGSNTLQTKVDLYNRTGSGWPDVVFSAVNSDASWAQPAGFTAPLDKGLIPASVLSQFSAGALAPCTLNGTVYCLRNDLAPVVLWYNAPLMKQWGYQVPTTWAQYEQIGQEVAKQHPGYIVGAVGDSFVPEIYMWASQCQANDITDIRSVTVNVTTANCTRMASLLDTLLKNKSMSPLSAFSSAFNKQEKGKVLMLPAPVWFAGSVFDTPTGLNTPKGQMAAAPVPQWPGTATATTGDVGGGLWLLSAHSAHLKAAVNFITWVATSNAYQGDLAPGLPAYAPAAKVWLANQQNGGYFANNIVPVVQQAAGQIWQDWGYGKYSQEAIWAATVTPGITSGKSIVSMLPAWQAAITNYATAAGYQVSH